MQDAATCPRINAECCSLLQNQCKILQFAIKSMLDSERGGAIIMVSSIAAINGMEKRASYSVSKAGLIGLTQSIAADYSKNNIRVFCLCPGYVKTSLTLPYLKSLNNSDIRASIDIRNEKIGKKIRDAEVKKIPLMIIIGEKETSKSKVSMFVLFKSSTFIL